ncbi:MAG: hypothetical protein RL711_1411 [Bacteroidota bacterium]|jgi:membrane associated rhomboid family serine protease
MFQITPIVRNLLIANVAIFFLSATLHLNETFSLYNVFAENFRPYQFISYMFLHADFNHIFKNMLTLFFFGPMLEMFWGAKKFLIFYMVCGLGAGMTYASINLYESSQLRTDISAYKSAPSADKFAAFVHTHVPEVETQLLDFENDYAQHETEESYIAKSMEVLDQVYEANVEKSRMVGASGAVFGILMAFGMLFPNTEMMLLFIPFPIKAKYLVSAYGLYEIYSTLKPSAGDNVAHVAHLGGMLFAFIMIMMWRKDRQNFY